MKKRKKSLPPLLFIISTVLLGLLIGINAYSFAFHPDPFTRAKIKMFSFSKGDHYFGRLALWRLFAFSDNWDQAKKLESKIDQTDLHILKDQFNPRNLRERLNQLAFIKSKTADDWLEIARIYANLGNFSQSQASVRRAYELDPIRTDIEKIYYSLGTASLTNLIAP